MNGERDDWYDDDDDLEPNCTICDGDGYTDCDDPLLCTSPHVGDLCECFACGGSGLACDQTIW